MTKRQKKKKIIVPNKSIGLITKKNLSYFSILFYNNKKIISYRYPLIAIIFNTFFQN